MLLFNSDVIRVLTSSVVQTIALIVKYVGDRRTLRTNLSVFSVGSSVVSLRPFNSCPSTLGSFSTHSDTHFPHFHNLFVRLMILMYNIISRIISFVNSSWLWHNCNHSSFASFSFGWATESSMKGLCRWCFRKRNSDYWNERYIMFCTLRVFKPYKKWTLRFLVPL